MGPAELKIILDELLELDEKASGSTDLAIVDSHEVESQINTEVRAMADLVIYTEGDADESFSRLLSWIGSDEALGEGLPTT